MNQGPPQPEHEVAEHSPRLRLTLRLRLCILMIALFALIICVMLGVFCLYERAAIKEHMHLELANWCRDLAIEVSGGISSVTDNDLAAARRRRLDVFPFQTLFIDVFHQSGAHVAGTEASTLRWADLELSSIPAASSPAIVTLPKSVLNADIPDAQHAKVAVIGVAAPDGERYALAVTTSDAFIQRRFSILSHLAIASGAMSILAAAATSWFIAGVAVAPFERLRDLAKRLEPGTAPQVAAGHVAAEVANLTEELERARRRIGDRFAAQERFLSNVSHEIKTPIAIMLVDAQTLSLENASPDVRKFVHSSQDELVRLGRLVESFLTLTRVQDGKLTPRNMAICANDIVMDSLESCAKMAEQYHVTLVPRLLADEEHVDAAVSGEPDLLRTMLDNLIRNAIRFSPEHGRIEISVSCNDSSIRIVTMDRGPGIPPDKLESIFDRFAQAHGGPRYQRGHGLGLAIAQGIAELHGGVIAAANRPDEGCVFTIHLPRIRPQLTTSTLSTPENGSTTTRNGKVDVT